MFKLSLATILRGLAWFHARLEAHVDVKKTEVAALEQAHAIASEEHAQAAALLANMKTLFNRE